MLLGNNDAMLCMWQYKTQQGNFGSTSVHGCRGILPVPSAGTLIAHPNCMTVSSLLLHELQGRPSPCRTPSSGQHLIMRVSDLIQAWACVGRCQHSMATWALAVVVSAMNDAGARPSSRSPATSLVGSLSK